MDLTSFLCPNTGESLTFDGESLRAGDVRVPIVRNIPRFVSSDNYAAAFGLQWNTFRRTQFDSYTGTKVTEQRLEESIGIPLTELRGKKVLEAGSGAGRFTEVLLKHGALVYSFDFSEAVEANYDNNMPHDNLTIFQADIESVPFASGFFDVVVCLGVLQHTPSTRRSLAELTRVLRPGGRLVCDHYKYQLGMFTSLYLFYWLLIRKLDSRRQMAFTDRLTDVFFPIHWRFRDNRLAQILLRRVSPINFYYGKFNLTKELHYEWSRLDTHDRNTDYFKRHITRRRLTRILGDLGYKEVDVSQGGTGYVCRAVK